MKQIKFRPLRLNKKTGKIIVASYAQWNKVRCANYSEFNLIVSNEYEHMDKSAFVYNHQGEQLFHFGYNPWDVHEHYASCIGESVDYFYLRDTYKDFVVINNINGEIYKNRRFRGADCDGTPTFTHYDVDRITEDSTCEHHGADAFEPVTVGYVLNWLGWFLYQLENAKLKVGA